MGSFGSGAGACACCWANIATGETNRIRSSTRAVERRRIMMGLLERSRLGVTIVHPTLRRLQVRKKVSHKGAKGRHKGTKVESQTFVPLCLPFAPLCENLTQRWSAMAGLRVA